MLTSSKTARPPYAGSIHVSLRKLDHGALPVVHPHVSYCSDQGNLIES
jgi:hypothetical protein